MSEAGHWVGNAEVGERRDEGAIRSHMAGLCSLPSFTPHALYGSSLTV